jgi:predicted dehydrogenase
MGSQRRSWPKIMEGIKRLHEGVIGTVHYSRAWYANTRGPIGKREPVATPPANLDWDLWQGPAPRVQYDKIYHPYNWHWLWHFGNGECGNNGIHAIDLSRWGLGVDYPTRVAATGGRHYFDDDQETPDTHIVSIDFPGGKSIMWEGQSCNSHGIEGSGFGATFHGDKGAMVMDSSGYTLYAGRHRELEKVPGGGGNEPHQQNFLDAIREDKPLNAEIELGHKSTVLCHLGNIAYRTGRTLHCDPANGHIKDDAEAAKLWTREYEPGWEPKV